MNSHMKAHIQKNMHYFERVKEQMEKHELKAKSIHFRRNLLERQKVANYTNELDRVRGLLSQTVLHPHTKRSLITRASQLKALGAEATNGIK